MNESEKKWKEAQQLFGWGLPPKANWFLRLPGIRLVRHLVLFLKLEWHYSHGIGSLGLRSGYDEWVLYAVARGWC